MSGRVSPPLSQQKPQQNQPLHVLLKSLSLESLTLLFTQTSLYFSIFLFFALPLSFLLFTLSSSSHPIRTQILRLHSVASLAASNFEARQVWKESRDDAISLLYNKIMYFVPIYLLSLASSVAAVTATVSASSNRHVGVRLVFSAVKSNWVPPLVTSICAYALMMVYSGVPRVLVVLMGMGSPGLRLAICVVGSGFEVYLMAVIGMGMVVSIVESQVGWEAIRVGLDLMDGRWVCGWMLSGLMALATGGIGWRMEVLMGEGEYSAFGSGWMADRVGWEWVGLVGLYGVVVVWGYVVATVFYCECRKRNVTSGEEDGVEGLNL